MKLLLASALVLLGTGCRTVATEVCSPVPSVRLGTRARAWELRSAGEPRGLVVLFQEGGRARDSLYLVRNLWHQDLGLIDGLGRAYRYLPHLEEPVWVGSGTVLAGAQRILDAGETCELVEIADPGLLPVPGAGAEKLVDGREIGAETHALAPTDAPPSDEGLPQSR
jgi:hypothetical protein